MVNFKNHQDFKGQKIIKEGLFSTLHTEHLLLNEASLKQKHWQVWEWVVNNKNSAYTANDVIFEAIYNKAKGNVSFITWESILKRILHQTKPSYLSVIDKKATPVAQTKDTFLQRNKTEITNNSNQTS